MTPERWKQVDQLLAKVLELPGPERASFLAEACGSDEELRREVASLLAAHEEAEAEFLATPALAAAARDLAQSQHHSLVGTTFGGSSTNNRGVNGFEPEIVRGLGHNLGDETKNDHTPCPGVCILS